MALVSWEYCNVRKCNHLAPELVLFNNTAARHLEMDGGCMPDMPSNVSWWFCMWETAAWPLGWPGHSGILEEGTDCQLTMVTWPLMGIVNTIRHRQWNSLAISEGRHWPFDWCRGLDEQCAISGLVQIAPSMMVMASKRPAGHLQLTARSTGTDLKLHPNTIVPDHKWN